MKPESMRSVSAVLLHVPVGERLACCKTSNGNITTGSSGMCADLNKGREKENRGQKQRRKCDLIPSGYTSFCALKKQ